MANRKKKSKISDYPNFDNESDGDVKDEQDAWGEASETSYEVKTEDEDGSSPHSGILSLDMLAQVATDRLHSDPRTTKSKSDCPKKFAKISKRSLLNMDFLHLDQIRTLSPKFLVNLFGEMNSNEITRNYSFTCFIMPEKCSASYSSFGSEIKARELMKDHLIKHVEELVRLKAANEGFSFIAETVVAKKKRELAEKSMRRKKSAWNVCGMKAVKKIVGEKSPKSSKVNTKKYTGMKTPKSPKPHRNADKSVTGPKKRQGSTSPASSAVAAEFPAVVSENEYAIVADIQNDHVYLQDDENSKADGEWDIIEDRKMPFKRTGRNVERNENIIWDILCASQPYHDHSYTTVFGKRKAGQAFEDMAMLEMEEEDPDDESRLSARTSGLKFSTCSPLDAEDGLDVKPVMVKVGDSIQNKMHIPIVKVEFSAAQDGSAVVGTDIMAHSINRPYPPMPKSDLAQQGRLPVPEEHVSSSEEDSAVTIVSPSKRHKRKFQEGSLEWERRLALKCIRELRLRKKEDETGLVCKICKDKTFTASATLMYHYRSHAGIKPFVCLICNTTFTRQHSLNYHMLIHNNQSRFTCVDCGRKFRHPSHFKEHLRRHTGETPFHCMDCPIRFKTRNTYKRHLKTRHGKLLTANGIRLMPREEFLKIFVYAVFAVILTRVVASDEPMLCFTINRIWFNGVSYRVRTKYARDDPAEEFEGDDVDDEDDDLDLDPDAEIEGDMLDSENEQGSSSDNYPAEDMSPDGAADMDLQSSTRSSLADSSASNKLLQLCSQIVQQEAG